LGRTTDARQWLEKARQLLDPALTVGQSTGILLARPATGDERMRLAVLRREAESLILGDEKKKASNLP
jgi:hypothetical protein